MTIVFLLNPATPFVFGLSIIGAICLIDYILTNSIVDMKVKNKNQIRTKKDTK